MNKKINKQACQFTAGEVTFGDNGENAKTVPFKALARTHKAIEHPFWGNAVHDMDGMILNKPRLTTDYCHNQDMPIGWMNHFDVSTGDLWVGGTLKPYGNNKAVEVINMSKGDNGEPGVPYEFSIDFSASPLVIEEVAEGETVAVHTKTNLPPEEKLFTGPGVVFRQWCMRGGAFCIAGADQWTNTQLSNDENQTIEAKYIDKGEKQMSNEKAVEGEAVETVKPVEAEKLVNVPVEGEATEATPVEAESVTSVVVAVTTGASVEVGEDEDEPTATETPVEPQAQLEDDNEDEEEMAAKQLTKAEGEKPVEVNAVDKAVDRLELKRFINEFGSDGANWFADGVGYTEAKERFVNQKMAKLERDNSQLTATNGEQATRIKQLEALVQNLRGETKPVTFCVDAEPLDAKQMAIKAEAKKAAASVGESAGLLGAVLASKCKKQ